ncbi:hypothetical protein N2152v2_001821 [Parachlorella kessleri]
MASTLLEQTRQFHEDVERLERLIVRDFKNEAKSHKEKLMQAHRVRQMLDTIQERTAHLASREEMLAGSLQGSLCGYIRMCWGYVFATIYQDDDGSRKEEIAALRGDNVYSNFYDRLKELREYHRRFPNTDITEAENDEAVLREEPQVPFSGEEGLGRYLDLHDHLQAYVNSKFGKQVDYYTYVSSSLLDLDSIPRPQRLGKAYREYLQGVVGYLEGFYQRTQPLAQLDKQYAKLEEEFGQAWEAGAVEGWEDRGVGGGQAPGAAGSLDLDAFDSVEELEMLGADRLKEALAALGLKCGGTLQQRAERLMAVKGKDLSQVDRALFAKGQGPQAGQGSEAERRRQGEAARATALLEAKLRRLAELLGSVIEDTKGRIEKRQAQTYEEMLQEQQEAEEEAAPEGGSEDDEDEYIYNPLKLPLGWDGKPIPYWLYKLHGLNQEFKCEICGNASYWGRRAFERHFKVRGSVWARAAEWRHLNGMKALGIPNSKQFFEVTTIADALALWKSLQEREKGGFKQDVDEEFEDAQGNVYNKKTYEDLKRQGLI